MVTLINYRGRGGGEGHWSIIGGGGDNANTIGRVCFVHEKLE